MRQPLIWSTRIRNSIYACVPKSMGFSQTLSRTPAAVESGRPEEFHLQSPTGRVEGWRGARKPVSSPRLVKRSMRISRTTLTLLTSSDGLCDLSNRQHFQTLSRPYSTCSCRIRLRLQVYLPSQVLQIDGRLYHLVPASQCVVGRLLTAGPLCSPGVTPVHR